ncbi:hypothetical protein KUCAC02_019576, partial [Chaenocephalus aceratus]
LEVNSLHAEGRGSSCRAGVRRAQALAYDDIVVGPEREAQLWHTYVSKKCKSEGLEKSQTCSPFTSSLPNGSERRTVFTAMANILVNANLLGVWKMAERERREREG